MVVEGIYRQQVAALVGGQDLRLQVVEDQRFGALVGVVGQHHVRALQLQGFDEGQAQLVAGHAQAQQAEVLGDGDVLAVATAAAEGFARSGPVIGLAPDLAVFAVQHAAVDEAVDPFQQCGIVGAAGRRQHLLPGVQAIGADRLGQRCRLGVAGTARGADQPHP